MNDDSFEKIIAREGIAPPPVRDSESDSADGFGKSPPHQGAAILPPDCGDDAPFSEKTWYAANGFDRRRLKDLLRAKPDAELDLHGMTAAAAYLSLDGFLRAQLADGRRNVEIIHGRGGHSADGRAVLRDKTRKWLAGCGAVLGFIEPPRNSGAVRVLLRRE
ncbi:MAG: Smr/MutS family protein [Gammaproteobacteria bacterium]